MPRPNAPQPAAGAAAVVAAPQATQATQVASAVAVLEHDLESKSGALAAALAGRYDAAYFQSVALSQFRRSPALWQATTTVQGRVSFVDAVVQAAQYGLPFLAGRAYLVPYRNHGVQEVQLIVGYQGLVDLVTAPGNGVTFVEAAVVYARDQFSFRRGTDAYLHHVDHTADDESGVVDRGRPVAVWARVSYDNGQSRFEVYDHTRIEAVRRRSRAGDAGPWVTDWAEMAKKTVLRNLCKTLRLSLRVMELLEHEDEFERGAEPAPANPQAQLRQRLAARMAPDAATAADSGLQAPAPTTGAPPAPAAEQPATAAAAAPDADDVDDVVDGVWASAPAQRAHPPSTAGTCHATVAGAGTALACSLAAGHRGKHSDGLHDWP